MTLACSRFKENILRHATKLPARQIIGIGLGLHWSAAVANQDTRLSHLLVPSSAKLPRVGSGLETNQALQLQATPPGADSSPINYHHPPADYPKLKFLVKLSDDG